MSVDKIYTNYIPLLDEVVYNLKLICRDIVIKDSEKAGKYETVESNKKSDLYILCVEDRARIDLFNYTVQDFINIGVPTNIIDSCIKDIRKLPERFKNKLLKDSIKEYIENYKELNPYYRVLNGKPESKDQKIKVPSNLFYLIPSEYKIDTAKYIDEMDSSEQDILNILGITEKLITLYPNYKYLDHIGSKCIDIYSARKADRFQLLYIPTSIPKAVSSRFKEKYEMNRSYTLNTIYSDAFKYGSDNYDDFIKLFITVQTMIDIITQLPDFIIKKDIFDIKMVELMFKSNGIDYFPEIPLKYQLSMVKNINRLIKYKSTTKNIVDICSLFGCDNIEVFKYYILKIRNVDKDGHYINLTKLDKNNNEIEDVDSNYSLKFLKVPIDEIADNYLYDKKKYLDYDEVTTLDKYWDGEEDHNKIKKEILSQEFNYEASKYMSIDTLYSLSEISFQQIYFYNMIFDDKKVEELLTINVQTIDPIASFRLSDILCYLFAIMYFNFGIKDKLFTSPSKALSIKGFNFKVNMQTLANYIDEKGYTLKDLGINDFQIQDNNILTYNRLMEIFTKNKNIYDHVVNEMVNANNKDIYDIYKKIYDSLMLMKLTNNFFKLKDGTMASTYTEFLQERSPILYNSLKNIKKIKNKEIQKDKINRIIGDTIYVLEEYIDTTNFKYIFSQFPTVSAESIKEYLYKVINFFKSYKMQIYNINTIYKFDDKLENRIEIIDKIILGYEYTKQDIIEIIEKTYSNINLTKEDKITMSDNLYKEIYHEITKYFDQSINLIDKFKKYNINLSKSDNSYLNDNKKLSVKLFKNMTVEIFEKMQRIVSLSKKEKLNIRDNIYIYGYATIEKYFDSNINISESINIDSLIQKNDIYEIYDTISLSYTE